MIKLLPKIPKGKVLDIGAGEGRNSIFLAKNGFKVEAIDLTKQGLKKLTNYAKQHHLKIITKAIDIRRFNFTNNRYSLVLAINSLNFLKLSEVKEIIKRINKSLLPQGIFYLIVISIKDPVCRRCKKNLKMIEKNTFFIPKISSYRHFFSKQELLSLFEPFKIIEITEKKVKDTHGKPHYHYIFNIISKKTNK